MLSIVLRLMKKHPREFSKPGSQTSKEMPHRSFPPKLLPGVAAGSTCSIRSISTMHHGTCQIMFWMGHCLKNMHARNVLAHTKTGQESV